MVSKSVIYCSVCMAAVAAELWCDHQHPHFEMRMPQGPMSPYGAHVNLVTTATNTSTSSR
jgi:hypothetical protein